MRKQFLRLAGVIMMLSACVLSKNSATAQTTDVGVAAYVSPTGNLCSGTADVTVIIQNFGTNDVYSMSIDWSVNGAAQSTINYTDTLLAGATDTVLLGSWSLLSGNFYEFITYTSAPNAGLDDDATNDTLSSGNLTIPLSGTYTVGGTTPDYARLSDAVAALTTFGVCGPVILDMRSGTDTIRVSIPAINGSSTTNTITIRSENGDSSSVKLTYPSETVFTNLNYILQLNGADHINLERITLERTGLEPYARIIDFKNSSCFINITGCRFLGAPTTQVSNSLAAILYSSAGTPTNDSNVVIHGNRFENGSMGIYLNGIASLNPENGLIITDNILLNQYAFGMFLTNHGDLNIVNNTISTNTSYTSYTGIELDRSQRAQLVSKNRISGNVKLGMNFIDCSGYNGTPGITANNFIQATDSIGIRLNNGEYQEFIYNSVNMIGSGSTATELSGTGIGNRLINNVLTNLGGGLAIRLLNATTSGISASDYNDLYTTGAILGWYNNTNTANLSAWKTASLRDSNSVSADPRFASTTDLHASATAIDNEGISVPSVSDDIDGEARSSTPSIGADEFVGTPRDLTVTAIISPEDSACGSANTTVTIIVANNGSVAETGFPLFLSSSALGAPISENYAGSLAAGTSDTVTFSATVNTSAGGNISFTAYSGATQDDDRSNDSSSITVFITAAPVAPLASGDSICLGSTATVSAVGAGTVNWYDAATGGNLLGTGTSYTATGIIATTDIFAADVINGCESGRAAASVVVLPLPVVNLGNDQNIVQGNSTTLDAGAGFSTYTWSNGATTQTITVNTDDCYSVLVTNSYGCEGTDTVCVNIILPSDLAVSAVLSPVNGSCGRAAGDVTVQVINLGPNAAINIPVLAIVTGAATANLSTIIAGPLAANDSITVVVGTVNTATGGNVTIDAYTNYGAETVPGNDHQISAVLTVPQPALPTGLDALRCGPGTVVLNASSSQTVAWYDVPSGGGVLSNGSSFTTPFLSQTTTYYAQSGIVCINQDRVAITATILDLPAVDLGADTLITGPITLIPSVTGTAPFTYVWSTTETTATISVNQNGDYAVSVTDANGCVGTDTVNVQLSVGIDNLTASSWVSLYPNPARQAFVLRGGVLSNDVTVSIIDLRGTVVYREIVAAGNKALSHEINVSRLAKGIYLVSLTTNSSSQQIRLVIE